MTLLHIHNGLVEILLTYAILNDEIQLVVYNLIELSSTLGSAEELNRNRTFLSWEFVYLSSGRGRIGSALTLTDRGDKSLIEYAVEDLSCKDCLVIVNSLTLEVVHNDTGRRIHILVHFHGLFALAEASLFGSIHLRSSLTLGYRSEIFYDKFLSLSFVNVTNKEELEAISRREALTSHLKSTLIAYLFHIISFYLLTPDIIVEEEVIYRVAERSEGLTLSHLEGFDSLFFVCSKGFFVCTDVGHIEVGELEHCLKVSHRRVTAKA